MCFGKRIGNSWEWKLIQRSPQFFWGKSRHNCGETCWEKLLKNVFTSLQLRLLSLAKQPLSRQLLSRISFQKEWCERSLIKTNDFLTPASLPGSDCLLPARSTDKIRRERLLSVDRAVGRRAESPGRHPTYGIMPCRADADVHNNMDTCKRRHFWLEPEDRFILDESARGHESLPNWPGKMRRTKNTGQLRVWGLWCEGLGQLPSHPHPKKTKRQKKGVSTSGAAFLVRNCCNIYAEKPS